jgi:hypothetical protein
MSRLYFTRLRLFHKDFVCGEALGVPAFKGMLAINSRLIY